MKGVFDLKSANKTVADNNLILFIIIFQRK